VLFSPAVVARSALRCTENQHPLLVEEWRTSRYSVSTATRPDKKQHDGALLIWRCPPSVAGKSLRPLALLPDGQRTPDDLAALVPVAALAIEALLVVLLYRSVLPSVILSRVNEIEGSSYATPELLRSAGKKRNSRNFQRQSADEGWCGALLYRQDLAERLARPSRRTPVRGGFAQANYRGRLSRPGGNSGGANSPAVFFFVPWARSPRGRRADSKPKSGAFGGRSQGFRGSQTIKSTAGALSGPQFRSLRPVLSKPASAARMVRREALILQSPWSISSSHGCGRPILREVVAVSGKLAHRKAHTKLRGRPSIAAFAMINHHSCPEPSEQSEKMRARSGRRADFRRHFQRLKGANPRTFRR